MYDVQENDIWKRRKNALSYLPGKAKVFKLLPFLHCLVRSAAKGEEHILKYSDLLQNYKLAKNGTEAKPDAMSKLYARDLLEKQSSRPYTGFLRKGLNCTHKGKYEI